MIMKTQMTGFVARKNCFDVRGKQWHSAKVSAVGFLGDRLEISLYDEKAEKYLHVHVSGDDFARLRASANRLHLHREEKAEKLVNERLGRLGKGIADAVTARAQVLALAKENAQA